MTEHGRGLGKGRVLAQDQRQGLRTKHRVLFLFGGLVGACRKKDCVGKVEVSQVLCLCTAQEVRVHTCADFLTARPLLQPSSNTLRRWPVHRKHSKHLNNRDGSDTVIYNGEQDKWMWKCLHENLSKCWKGRHCLGKGKGNVLSHCWLKKQMWGPQSF